MECSPSPTYEDIGYLLDLFRRKLRLHPNWGKSCTSSSSWLVAGLLEGSETPGMFLATTTLSRMVVRDDMTH